MNKIIQCATYYDLLKSLIIMPLRHTQVVYINSEKISLLTFYSLFTHVPKEEHFDHFLLLQLHLL